MELPAYNVLLDRIEIQFLGIYDVKNGHELQLQYKIRKLGTKDRTQIAIITYCGC